MHDRSDIHFSSILKWGLGLLAVAVIAHLTIWRLFDFLNNRAAQLDPKPSPIFQQNQRPPEPQLQVTPVMDLQNYRAEEQRLLNSYDWVDREKGIVRIPVNEAMNLLIKKEKAASTPQPAEESGGADQ